jgi:tryptophan 2-monooxygenase
MSIHKQQKIDLTRVRLAAPASPWLWSWPNTADYNFNYYNLLALAGDGGIGSNPNPNFRIAVIGGGVAGLTAARELYRSGYANIDIYEATNRLGGRTFSVPANGQQTCFELGAMRLPFFNTDPNVLPGNNSALAWYTTEYGISFQPFPDPGSSVANTGIYLNDGFGPVHVPAPGQKPELLLWITQGLNPPPPPPTAALQAIYDRWNAFATMFTDVVAPAYGTDGWTDLWHAIVENYWEINFRDFAYLPVRSAYDPSQPGNFGGLGLTQDQAQLLYTIGVGDGSWGAFYDISVLYIFRTMLFGYGNQHQLILGNLAGGPQQNQQLTDSGGNTFMGPTYLGVQSYAECMFFEPVQSAHASGSLYDAMQNGNVKLFTSTLVNSINKTGDGIVLTTKDGRIEAPYDAVIMSPPTWAMQINTPMNGFDVATEWPFAVQTSFAMSHWIRSCKVMYPLKERFWEVSRIPQLLSTDIQLQGVYAYAAGETDPGVLLVSYTWEDDANKFLAQGFEATLGSSLLQLLDDILLRCTNVQQKISPFVDTSQGPTIMQWSLMPTYLACAKLYHERSWDLDYALLRYNQNFSARSGIYFAGEGFSVEGGWTEPALRGALDAVVHLINDSGGTFVGGFDFATDYPRYSEWSPYRGSSDRLRAALLAR